MVCPFSCPVPFLQVVVANLPQEGGDALLLDAASQQAADLLFSLLGLPCTVGSGSATSLLDINSSCSVEELTLIPSLCSSPPSPPPSPHTSTNGTCQAQLVLGAASSFNESSCVMFSSYTNDDYLVGVAGSQTVQTWATHAWRATLHPYRSLALPCLSLATTLVYVLSIIPFQKRSACKLLQQSACKAFAPVLCLSASLFPFPHACSLACKSSALPLARS